MASQNFTINFVDPNKSTITISPTATNGPSGFTRHTDIDILGMGSNNWGEAIIENMIHMLENFACPEDIHAITKVFVPNNAVSFHGDVRKSFTQGDKFEIIGSDVNDGVWTVQNSAFDQLTNITTVTVAEGLNVSVKLGVAGHQGWPHRSLKFSPVKPVEGQVWYNKTRGQVFVYTQPTPTVGYWKRISSLTVSSIQPPAASEGDLWWDTNNYAPSSAEFGRNLNVFVGNSWIRGTIDALPRDGSKPMTGPLNMGSQPIINVGAPTSPNDVINLGEADKRYVAAAGGEMTGDLNMALNRVTNVGTPVQEADALTFGFADDRFVKLVGNNVLFGTLVVNSTNAIETDGSVKVGHLQANGDGVIGGDLEISNVLRIVDQYNIPRAIRCTVDGFVVENIDGSFGKIWNSANQGHSSALDADTLDTHHASDFALKSYADSISKVANGALTLERLYDLTYPPSLSASPTSSFLLLDERRASVGAGGQNQTVLSVRAKVSGTVRVKIAKRSVYSNGGVGVGFLIDGAWVYGGWNVNNSENTDWQYYDIGVVSVLPGMQLQVFAYNEFTGGADVSLQLFIDAAGWPASYSDASHWFDVVT